MYDREPDEEQDGEASAQRGASWRAVLRDEVTRTREQAEREGIPVEDIDFRTVVEAVDGRWPAEGR